MQWERWFSRGVLGLVGVASAGCAIVRSAPGQHGAEGVAYMLPKVLLPVELSFDGQGFDLSVKSSVTVGDPEHVYAMQQSGNVFTSDTVAINVDPVTGLLSGVNVTSQDQSAEALKELVTGLKGMKTEGATAGDAAVVFSEHFDPGWAPPQVQEFNQRLQATALAAVASAQTRLACGTPTGTDDCRAAEQLAARVKAQPLTVSVDGPAVSGPVRPMADCGAGFCYRINMPHVLRLSGAGISRSEAFAVPNRSPTFVMPLARWAFVTTSHDVKLRAGVFESVTTTRPSSAYAVAAVPFDIAKGAVSAASEMLQLKLDFTNDAKALSEAQQQLMDAQTKEREARDALEAALKTKMQPKAEGSVLGGSGLSLRVGPRRDAAQGLTTSGNPQPAAASGATAGASSGAASKGSSGQLDPQGGRR